MAAPDQAAFCPECGHDLRPEELARGRVGVLPETLAGALAYFLVPAIAFLLLAPYDKNKFVRFHSFQCIGALLAAIVLGAILRIAAFALGLIPGLGMMLLWLMWMVLSLAFLMLWVVLAVKALQGVMWRLPVIGDFAARRAAKLARTTSI